MSIKYRQAVANAMMGKGIVYKKEDGENNDKLNHSFIKRKECRK